MKIKIKRLFRHHEGPRTIKDYNPGVYDVGKDISQHVADLALRFGRVEVVVEPVVEKKAPENKVVEAPENKSRVAKKSGSRRSTGTKFNQ